MKIIADVGGSRGRWVIVDKTIVKTIETDGFNPYTYKISSLNKILENIKSSVETFEFNKIIYYGAGINNLETRNIVEKSIKDCFKNTEITVLSDLLGSCRALCKDKRGVVSILGTGSNSCLYDGEKIIQNSSSLGFILGDECSGNYFGKKILSLFFNNQLPNYLREKFIFKYKNEINSIIDNIYYDKRPNIYIAKFFIFIQENKNHKIIKKPLVFIGFSASATFRT